MDAHWLGIFSHCACRVVISCGANFCLFTSSGQHGHETNIYDYQIPSSNYSDTTSDIKYSKFYIFKYDFWNTILYKFHIYIHLNSNETM